MNEAVARHEEVACPFCGLLCDDLSVDVSASNVHVTANGCARSRALFPASGTTVDATASIKGRRGSLDAALSGAARILLDARHPRFVSAGADVAASRAMVALAEHCGGVVDHANSEVLAGSQRVLRQSGWNATTLTEVRNRADFIVVAGEDVMLRFPRFYERCFGEFDTLFDTGPREAWFLGPVPPALSPAMRPRARSIPLEATRLAEAFAVMRALHAGRRVDAQAVAGVPVAQLSQLLERMRRARYGVLVWSVAGLAEEHADLAVQAMCALVGALNEKGRFSVLPLAGTDGDLSFQQVATWQTGFPAPVDFRLGSPAPGTGARHDSLLFVSTMDAARVPPASGGRTIVIGHPAMARPDCDVFIPAGVPGVHHEGHLYRTDSVVAVPLRRLADTTLPRAAAVLERLLGLLRESA